MGLQDRRMFNFGTNANFKNLSASRTKELPMSQNNIDFFEAKRQSSKSFSKAGTFSLRNGLPCSQMASFGSQRPSTGSDLDSSLQTVNFLIQKLIVESIGRNYT